MSMYNDFLNRREELEGSSINNGGATVAATLDNVPNVSSAAIASIANNLPPSIAASAQVAEIASATTAFNITNATAAIANQSSTVSLIPTVQPSDIAARTTATNSLGVNLQIMPEGFGSYLQDILPKDIATTAGAFSASMQQIKKIRTIPIEKFAQVVATLETTRGLNLVNGTNVPTDTTEAQAALALIALGSGPYGTYTFSDFFGCMSGLPYPWVQIQPAIIALQSSTLTNIYQQLYLAVTWKQATLTVIPSYSTSAVENL